MNDSAVHPIDPAIRPGKIWYWIVVLMMLALIGTGVGLFVRGLLGALSEAPDLRTTYGSGQTATLTLDGHTTQAIYLVRASRTRVAPGTGCTALGPTGTEAQLTRPPATFTFTKNGHSWAWALTLHADTTGRYQVTCNGSRFAVASSPNVSGFATRLATGIVALVGGLLLGILGGTFGLIVVARRRRAARLRAGLPPPADNR